MSSKVANNAPWDEEHTLALLRGIIFTLLSSRSSIYAIPKLQEVSNNGGNRINAKLQQMLQKFADTIPGGAGMVKEEVGKVSKSPKKAKDGGQVKKEPGTPSPSKRKRAAVKKEHLEMEEGEVEDEESEE